jgi:uncharacterized protein YuzE
MGEKGLIFSYDREGDVLDISIGDPKEAISNEIENDVFVRMDPVSHEVIGFSILNFQKRMNSELLIGLPIEAKFDLLSKGA